MGSPLFTEIAGRKKIGMPTALNISLRSLSTYAVEEFRNKNGDDKPHKRYASFFNTDLERLMFDRFYHIFIINRGKAPTNVTFVDKI